MSLANVAVDLTGQSDDPIAQANAMMDLGEVLAAAGRPVEADAARASAINLYEQKGDIVSAAAARQG